MGCVDGDCEPSFNSLKEHFHGKVLSSNEGEIMLKLASLNHRLVFSIFNESNLLYEASLDSDSAYFGMFKRSL